MSKPLCRFYQENKCRKGANCQFRHDNRIVPSLAPGSSRSLALPKPPCIFWSSGRCMKGENCEFSHAALQPAFLPSRPSQQLCKFFLQGKCAAGNGCNFVHAPAAEVSSPVLLHAEPTPPPPVSPIAQVPCRFFAQGRCTAAQCPFLHSVPLAAVVEQRRAHPTPAIVDPPNLTPVFLEQPEPAVDTEWQDWRPIAGTHVRVRYGDGGAVQEVMTAFDSTRVLLANLPLDVLEDDVVRLVASFGDVQDVTVYAGDTNAGKTTALTEFDSCASASNAAAALSGSSVISSSGSTSVITASVQPRAGERGSATLRSNSVKLTFHAPSKVAYAHYESIRSAKQEAERLDGLKFHNRLVSAKFQKPTTGQFESFTVVIGSLPVDASKERVKRFARAGHVDLAGASYEEYAGLLRLRSVLQQFDALESLETQPTMPGATKLKALARFSSPAAAEEATKSLNGKQQQFLGRSLLWIERIFSVKYPVPRGLYSAVKDQVALLELGQSADDSAAKIRVYDVDSDGKDVDPVTLRIYCDEPKPLGRLKMAVEQRLAGEKWTHESGTGVWDDCFLEASGEGLLTEAIAAGKAFARCDARRRCVLLYGTSDDRKALKRRLQAGLDKLKERRGVLPLDRKAIRRLVTGGLARVQAFYGLENVKYNVSARTLEVRAEDVDLDTLRQLLNDPGSVVQDAQSVGAEGGPECPICFCDVTKPATLACGHSYCAGCIQHYLSSAASGDSFPMICLAQDGQCGAPIDAKDLARLMKPGDQDKLTQASFLAHTRARPAEFKYCPTADCPELYRPTAEGTMLQCPSCLTDICSACHTEFHDGYTCAGYREMKSGRGGDESFRLWREQNFVQACPGCGTLLDKYEGCNHVTCVVCKTHMCWKCLGVFGSSEIYEHMRIKHGSIHS